MGHKVRGVDSAGLIARLDQWHRLHRSDYWNELQSAASLEDLSALEARVGAKLPPLYRALMSWRNGQPEECLDSFFEGKMWMSSDAIECDTELRDKLLEDGAFDQPLWWNERWLPFLGDGQGFLCIDFEGCFGGHPGQIIEFWGRDPARSILYSSFEAWLETFVLALEQDMFREDGEGEWYPISSSAFSSFVHERNPGYPIPATAAG